MYNNAVADLEGVRLKPPLRPNNFIFMGIFKKNEVKSENRTHPYKSQPPFQKLQ